jgi:rubrerythrin
MERIKWRCIVCGYVHEGRRPPSHCPICGAPAGMFERMDEAGQGAENVDKTE